jgi:hypothetical protein
MCSIAFLLLHECLLTMDQSHLAGKQTPLIFIKNLLSMLGTIKNLLSIALLLSFAVFAYSRGMQIWVILLLIIISGIFGPALGRKIFSPKQQ